MENVRNLIDPAHFELRRAKGHEVLEGDPRTLVFRVGRGNSSYLFALTGEEARELLIDVAEGLESNGVNPPCIGHCR